jgi:hypothetical protein
VSEDKWRAATHATLLTYSGLFALFLTWRLVSTPFELDRERQRFINGLTKSLAYTKFKLAELQASPPAIELPESISLLSFGLEGCSKKLHECLFNAVV